MPGFGFLAPNIDSSALDVSDRYNNLKTAWDSLVEAANHWPYLLFVNLVLKAASFLSAGCFCVRCV
jgi:hypothetical protein